MLLKPVRAAFLVGLVVAAASTPVRAGHRGTSDCCAPCATDCCASGATACVPEYYKVTRTAYKWECRPEKYTAYRCEYVQEKRTRTCTYYERVCEVKDVVHNVCTMVPTTEWRTCCKPHYSYVNETKMVCKTVRQGHWECREVYCFAKDMKNRWNRFCHRNDCCECCQPCCEAPTRTKKVWVVCRVQQQCPVTTCRKVCTMVQEKVQVTVCRPVYRKEVCKQTCYRCVPKTRVETYCVCVPHRVAVECVRNVRVCVPYQETVTCCRMVPRPAAAAPVAAAPAAAAPCAPSGCCNCCCEERSHRLRDLFAGWRHRHHDNCGCDSGCGCH
jgi:hypothetical protein